jgi:hypothetical protein
MTTATATATSLVDRIKATIASGAVSDAGMPLKGKGHGPRCTSAYSRELASAGVRYVRVASGGQPSRAFPLEVVRQLESALGLRIAGKRQIARSK